MSLFSNTSPDQQPEGQLTDSLLLRLIFLLLSIIVCSLIGTLLIQLVGYLSGMNLAEVLTGLNPESGLAERNFVRLSHLLSQLTTFAVPALLLSWFFYRRQMWHYLRLVPLPPAILFWCGILLVICAFPLAQFFYWLNQQLPLPSWMMNMEDQANDTIKALLVMESPWVFLFNLTVIALLPAFGEELLFRGILQQQLEKRLGRAQAAIWITAVIFSAFHLQFAGFLPRMLLGALLGYLLYWTRSLWLPIAAHFIFNGAQVLGHYLVGETLLDTESSNPVTPNWPASIIAAALVAGLIMVMRKYRDPDEPNPAGQATGPDIHTD